MDPPYRNVWWISIYYYMKLYFNHEMGFGKMQHETMLYYPFGATFEPHERINALETGWFPINNVMWFQSRSTRLDLRKYEPSGKVLKLSKKIKYYPDVNMTPSKKYRLGEIYKKYIEYKKFRDQSLTVDDMISNSHGHIYYAHENEIIGFSFYKILGSNYLSIEFAWDYKHPSLSLGHVSIYLESLFARSHRCNYMYLSAGYEKCSLYKADYKGFQWWKGYEWSEDVDTFKKLCYNDEKVVINNFENI